MIDKSSIREENTLGQSKLQDEVEILEARQVDEGRADIELTDRASYATRLRVILLLSLVCWGLVLLAIAVIMELL